MIKLYKKDVLKYCESQISPIVAIQQINNKDGGNCGPTLFWIKNRGICTMQQNKARDNISSKDDYFKGLSKNSQFKIMNDQETYALIMLRSIVARYGYVEYTD